MLVSRDFLKVWLVNPLSLSFGQLLMMMMNRQVKVLSDKISSTTTLIKSLVTELSDPAFRSHLSLNPVRSGDGEKENSPPSCCNCMHNYSWSPLQSIREGQEKYLPQLVAASRRKAKRARSCWSGVFNITVPARVILCL